MNAADDVEMAATTTMRRLSIGDLDGHSLAPALKSDADCEFQTVASDQAALFSPFSLDRRLRRPLK